MVTKVEKLKAMKHAVNVMREYLREGKTSSPKGARFIIHRAEDGQYYFVLQAANNEVIAVSEMYKQKASALNGIESIIESSTTAIIEDRA